MQNIVVCVEEWVDPLTLVAYEGASNASKQKEVRKDDAGDDAIRGDIQYCREINVGYGTVFKMLGSSDSWDFASPVGKWV